MTVRLTIAGKEGSLEFDGHQLVGYRRGVEGSQLILDDLAHGLPPDEVNSIWRRAARHFVGALQQALDSGERGALAAAATFADGWHTQEVLDAAYSVGHRDKWVSVAAP
jgi:predicted dehydrogenase